MWTDDFERSKDVVERVRNNPWLIRNELRRVFAWPFARVQFALSGLEWGTGWKVYGRPIVQRHRKSRISIGDGLEIRSFPRSNPLAPNHPVVFATRERGAELELGDDCGLTSTTLVAADRVRLGDRVQVGANSTIVDTDFHPLTPERRNENFLDGEVASVTVEDDVFIGMESLVMKGVRIGEGSVVGAGSVVTQDVPPRTVVAGNPATVVREL